MKPKKEENGDLEEIPRARAITPSGTFLLHQMNSNFGQRTVQNVRGEARSIPLVGTVAGSVRSPTSLTKTPERDSQSFKHSKVKEPDRRGPETQTEEYFQLYEYDYYQQYADFEVQKTDTGALENSNEKERELVKESESEDGTKEESDVRVIPIKESPLPGESQGCLYDCVYDCVGIDQLSAYRDCVRFCGKTCQNK